MRLFEAVEMPIDRALSIFQITRDNLYSLSNDDLKNRWKNMMKLYHPDNPENKDKNVDVALINAAYDSIKKAKEYGNPYKRTYTPPQQTYKPPAPPKPTTPKIYKFDVHISNNCSNVKSGEILISFRSWLEARTYIITKYPNAVPLSEAVEVANRIYSDGRNYLYIRTNEN